MSIKELKPGIYEQPINQETQEALDKLDQELAKKEKIDEGLSSILLSQYIKSAVREALDQSGDQKAQFKLVNDIVSLLSNKVDESFNNYVIIYDDNEQFKSKKISEIIFMHTEKSINFDTMQTVIQTSEKIMKKVNQNVKNVDVIVAFTEGLNITFIKLSNNNMI